MYLIRLIIVGETGVGKTSLLIRFNEDNFILDQKTTIGVDYKAKEISIGEDSVKLQVILFSRKHKKNILPRN
jgi:GTPase SAR1 family protein